MNSARPGSTPLAPVAIALGSNLGDRQRHLETAVDQLNTVLLDLRVSSWFDTEPVGVGLQPRFLNGVVTGLTSRPPGYLLETLLQIERAHGRERPYPGAPRTLDLDLILYGDLAIEEPGLRIPHPRFRERPFVLEPLAALAPGWIDPETGKSVAVLWKELKAKR